MTRREAIKSTVAGAAASVVALSDLGRLSAHAQTAAPFELPPLPYATDALEPHIDARTMEIHHDKHHAGYVTNLNKAVEAHPALKGKSIQELLEALASAPDDVRTAVQNNGGGHYNHSLFWQMMKKDGGGEPGGKLGEAITNAFLSFDGFKDQFARAAMSRFGSGWAWLTVSEGKLQIESTPNQDTPITAGRVPILGLDVWEHAYYLKYQNRRADYVAAWFNVIDWDFVAARFDKFTA
jgi:Fe-Mn family superoxide dismutase